jgi:hypothetical protein
MLSCFSIFSNRLLLVRATLVAVIAVAHLLDLDVFIFLEFCMIDLMLEIAKLRKRPTPFVERLLRGALTLSF